MRGAGADGVPVVGSGVLTIAPADFARQLRTMQATDAPDARARLAALARFGRSFAGALFDTYGGVFAGSGEFDRLAPPRKPTA